ARERILRQRRQDVLAQQEVDDQIFQVLAEKQQLLQEQDCLVYHFPDKGQPFWVTKKEFEHRMQMIDDAHADLQARIKAQVTVRLKGAPWEIMDDIIDISVSLSFF
ncbi:unnamed protein product, partial [Cladocopium goreaui]